MTNTVRVVQSPNHLCTDGLRSLIGHEIKVVIKEWPVQSYWNVLAYLAEYIVEHRASIQNEQTIAYHSWMLRFTLDIESNLNLYEIASNGEGFAEGVDYAIKVINEQIEVCKEFNASPIFPIFTQKIVISEGVYEGLTTEAVRYPSPDHMTGWWLSTELYNGDTKSLNPVHYYHIAFKRPDILKYLALPFGYRFIINQEQEKDVWFDSKVV
jgi:hypothetical protein